MIIKCDKKGYWADRNRKEALQDYRQSVLPALEPTQIVFE